MTSSLDTNRKLKKNLIMATVIAAVFLIIGAVAFLTATDSKTNHFTMGNVDIEVIEPSWVPESNNDIVPLHVAAKDPQIKNTGSNKAYAFFKIEIPLVNVPTTTVKDNTEKELFEMLDMSNEWTLINTSSQVGKRTFIYVYGTVSNPTVLEAGSTTPAIFSSVKVLDFVNTATNLHPLAGEEHDIVVTGYAIQATGDDDIVGKTAPEIWNLFPQETDIA